MVRHVCFHDHRLQFPTEHSQQRATDRLATKKEENLLSFQFLRFTTVTQPSKSAVNNINTENLHNSTFHPSQKNFRLWLRSFSLVFQKWIKEGQEWLFGTEASLRWNRQVLINTGKLSQPPTFTSTELGKNVFGSRIPSIGLSVAIIQDERKHLNRHQRQFQHVDSVCSKTSLCTG